jgi:hypothetical protein
LDDGYLHEFSRKKLIFVKMVTKLGHLTVHPFSDMDPDPDPKPFSYGSGSGKSSGSLRIRIHNTALSNLFLTGTGNYSRELSGFFLSELYYGSVNLIYCRYAAKRFRKAQCPIVERLVNSLMMHGRNNGKYLID